MKPPRIKIDEVSPSRILAYDLSDPPNFPNNWATWIFANADVINQAAFKLVHHHRILSVSASRRPIVEGQKPKPVWVYKIQTSIVAGEVPIDEQVNPFGILFPQGVCNVSEFELVLPRIV